MTNLWIITLKKTIIAKTQNYERKNKHLMMRFFVELALKYTVTGSAGRLDPTSAHLQKSIIPLIHSNRVSWRAGCNLSPPLEINSTTWQTTSGKHAAVTTILQPRIFICLICLEIIRISGVFSLHNILADYALWKHPNIQTQKVT